MISHDRRRLLHFDVTAHPTAAWVLPRTLRSPSRSSASDIRSHGSSPAAGRRPGPGKSARATRQGRLALDRDGIGRGCRGARPRQTSSVSGNHHGALTGVDVGDSLGEQSHDVRPRPSLCVPVVTQLATYASGLDCC